MLNKLVTYTLTLVVAFVVMVSVIVVATGQNFDNALQVFEGNNSSQSNNKTLTTYNKPQDNTKPSSTSTSKPTISAQKVEDIFEEDKETFYEYKDNYEQRFSDTSVDWAERYSNEASYYNKMAHILNNMENSGDYHSYIISYIAFRDAMRELEKLHKQESQTHRIQGKNK